MTSRNDITGDEIKSKINSDAFRDNWEKIFGKKDNKDNKNNEKDNAHVAQSAEATDLNPGK